LFRIICFAEEVYEERFSCAPALFSAFAEAEGIDLETATSVSTSFGAGMASIGDTCGAVTGGMMVLGLKFGRTVADDTGAKEKNCRLVNKFVERFNEKAAKILEEMIKGA
jgi:C_GCAxxG_C_C family probable redox protein